MMEKFCESNVDPQNNNVDPKTTKHSPFCAEKEQLKKKTDKKPIKSVLIRPHQIKNKCVLGNRF